MQEVAVSFNTVSPQFKQYFNMLTEEVVGTESFANKFGYPFNYKDSGTKHILIPSTYY